ncbi:MAG: hypothetical protein PHR16_15165 [Methylovulum sp.]|nr:hypothetical protein [Methylovulum sp.]
MRNIINAVMLVFFISHSCFAGDENSENENNSFEQITLEQATRLVIAKDGSSRVLGAQTINVDGENIHIIKVLTPQGRIRHYKISAETGELIN